MVAGMVAGMEVDMVLGRVPEPGCSMELGRVPGPGCGMVPVLGCNMEQLLELVHSTAQELVVGNKLELDLVVGRSKEPALEVGSNHMHILE